MQVLKNVPFNIVLPHGNQLGVDKRGHLAAPDTTVTVSIATMPTHSIKTETQPHGFAVGIPPAVYHPEPAERVVVFDRSLNPEQFSSGAQPPNAQRRTPDSTFSEPFKEGVQEVGRRASSCGTLRVWGPPLPPYVSLKLSLKRVD